MCVCVCAVVDSCEIYVNVDVCWNAFFGVSVAVRICIPVPVYVCVCVCVWRRKGGCDVFS